MLADKTYKTFLTDLISSKLSDYVQLIKLRLSLLVVFSSLVGFILASTSSLDWAALISLAIGGLLVTGAANGLNQLIERESDKLMSRTQKRPLPDGRMPIQEALIASFVMAVLGVVIISYFINHFAAILAFTSLIVYVFIYTPLKRKTSFNVFVGAVSGAFPLLIGWAAATGTLGWGALVIFAIQFLWQFPHTWSLALRLKADYAKAGMKMLPSKSSNVKNVAIQIVAYTLMLIPVSLLPAKFGITGLSSAIIILLAGLGFLLMAFRLLITGDDKDAGKLMFASIIYLPIIQLSLIFDKL